MGWSAAARTCMTLTVGARIKFSACFTEGFDTADLKDAKAAGHRVERFVLNLFQHLVRFGSQAWIGRSSCFTIEFSLTPSTRKRAPRGAIRLLDLWCRERLLHADPPANSYAAASHPYFSGT